MYPLAALLLELPQREIGGQLPACDELTAIVSWARERNSALHLDGARLWECQRQRASGSGGMVVIWCGCFPIVTVPLFH